MGTLCALHTHFELDKIRFANEIKLEWRSLQQDLPSSVSIQVAPPHLPLHHPATLVLLDLLLSLPQLHFRVPDVTAQAVRVEIVIAGGLSERLSILPPQNKQLVKGMSDSGF